MQPANCLNCTAPLDASAHYYPQCGQKAALHRLSLHEIGHDALHYFTHADKGFLLLLKQLTLKTGTVAREFVLGKRKKYFPPLNFFLVAATTYVFLVNIYTPPRTPVVTEADKAYIQRIPDSIARRHVARIYERKEFAIHTINKYSNFIYIFATPLLACIIWLFYKKGVFNYTEHLVANLYISGYAALAQVLIFIPLGKLLGMAGNRALMAFFVFEVIYRSIFYYHFMARKNRSGALQAASISLIVILFWSFSSYWLVYAYIAHGLWGLFP